jgi:hypothetical protein
MCPSLSGSGNVGACPKWRCRNILNASVTCASFRPSNPWSLASMNCVMSVVSHAKLPSRLRAASVVH